ncbi:MAG TPA: glutathione S-transferase family protein [Rhizomicrobium sp.]|jgi:glutathione S-transferase|nr:glutathione S-transferase family protein [Rhizomicrobium sp.]
MTDEIIFHNYPNSPFSEKVRVAFGIKKLAWRSVVQPVIMPKPDLIPLTGGYRKIPVMQIGADVFCDSQIILRELERRFPTPSLAPQNGGAPYAIGFWADRQIFQAAVAIIFGEIGDLVPEDFKKDRAAMSGGSFSSEALKRAVPFMRDQYRAHTQFLADQLADGRPFWGGAQAGLADIHAFMNPWFIANALPHKAKATIAEFPKVEAWFERVRAIGHGTPSDMTPKEALAVAKAATATAQEAADPHDPGGRKPGDAVTVSADDYGRDPIAGTLVFSNAHEIAIRRSDSAVGEVVVHFPRAGFTVIAA